MAEIKLLKQSSGVLTEHDKASDEIVFKSVDVNANSDTIGGIQKQNLVDKTAAATITGDWDISGGALRLPQGASLPGSGDEGDIFWDTDDDNLYVYDGASWYQVFESFTVAGDSGSDTISGGDTLTVTGGTGITTSVSTDTVTIDGDDATTSTKGIASFNSDNFAVASGDVTIKDGGVANAELANDGITFTADSGGSGETQLGDTFTVAGGTGIDTVWSADQVSIAIDSTVATVTYVDNAVAAGGTVEVTAGAGGVAQYDVVYFSADDTVNKADADALATSRIIGIMSEAVAEDATGDMILPGGIVTGCGVGWTAGSAIFLSATAGELTDTAPSGASDVIVEIGIAKNTTDLVFIPKMPIQLAS